ncbi:MAG: response regulator [Opitutaceae bacterium]|nr:response regulator [Opitutaceae bacterium]
MPKPILLVDDDAFDRDLALRSLSRCGLNQEVATACDGEEALDYLLRRNSFATRGEGNPTLILLDIKIPKRNGIDVLHHIRTSDQLRLIPVVMLTSSCQETDVVRCYEIGANAYVVKPLGFKELNEVVREITTFWMGRNQPPPGCLRPSFPNN